MKDDRCARPEIPVDSYYGFPICKAETETYTVLSDCPICGNKVLSSVEAPFPNPEHSHEIETSQKRGKAVGVVP